MDNRLRVKTPLYPALPMRVCDPFLSEYTITPHLTAMPCTWQWRYSYPAIYPLFPVRFIIGRMRRCIAYLVEGICRASCW